MSLADELSRLDDLRQRGVLSDEEFQRAKQRLLDGPAVPPPAGVAAVNAFRRARDDRWFGGVCGGFARITGLASWAWRLIFTVLFFWGGAGLLVYLLLWIFVPAE